MTGSMFAWALRAAFVAAMPAAGVLAGNGPGLGDPLPGPIVATAVRDRIPSFREPGTTYVLVFLDTSSPVGRRAIPVMDRVARAHGRKAIVTSIHEDPAPTVREFADDPEWSPKLTFTVAADPSRTTNATGSCGHEFGPNTACSALRVGSAATVKVSFGDHSGSSANSR
ncbi:MAG: hypothetical protein ACKOV8_07105, partial [Phycisphaerales bacterium]